MKYFVSLCFVIYFGNCKAQVLISAKTDYCEYDTVSVYSLIGKKVKIYHEGGIYSTLNNDKSRKWLSEEVREHAGVSGWNGYKPGQGDTGTIAQIFITNGSGRRKFIFLLKIGNNYVPINCDYITDIDKPDSEEEWKKHFITDSLANIAYANGCKFKLRDQNINNEH